MNDIVQASKWLAFAALVTCLIGGGVALAVGVVSVDTKTAQTGTKTIVMGGVDGPLGHLGSHAGSLGTKEVGAKYGHDLDGETCDGSDSDTQENFLELKLKWTFTSNPNDPEVYDVDATSYLSSITYSEVIVENDACPQPRNVRHVGTASVSLFTPGVGSPGSLAGAHAVTLGSGSQPGSNQNNSMSTHTWHVDPADTGTHTLWVRASVRCAYDGVVEDVKEFESDLKADAKMTVSYALQ